jgi:hypothetical protein
MRRRLLLGLIRRTTGEEPSDVTKTHLYRPNVFGRWASPAHDVMRGPSSWTLGERELFAAYVSRRCCNARSESGLTARSRPISSERTQSRLSSSFDTTVKALTGRLGLPDAATGGCRVWPLGHCTTPPSATRQ